MKDLNVRSETIKLLEEDIGRTLDNINQNRILYDPPSRVTEIKTNVNKQDLIKLESFRTANYKQSEKTTLRMGENNSKLNKLQSITFQKYISSLYNSLPEKQTTQ